MKIRFTLIAAISFCVSLARADEAIVVGTLSFVQAYGQFVYALTLLSQQELHPATVGIYSFVGAEYADWHRVMAFSSIFVLPILLLFLSLQRKIVAGLTAGALKPMPARRPSPMC
jgi:multiple sugar transport system permease protein